LLILVNIAEIDGVGNVLAQSGPCGIDQQGFIRVGQMIFDIADLNQLMQTGKADMVLLHEMGHVS